MQNTDLIGNFFHFMYTYKVSGRQENKKDKNYLTRYKYFISDRA